jgi:hypothetical protein
LKRILPFLIVAVLPFVFYAKLFHPDPEERLIFRGDFLNQHYVWKSYALERVKAGELPLWNPHILGGEPFHANPQVGIFYPPTYLLAPFHRDGRVSYVALEAYQLAHQAFAGAGMLLLMGSLGVGTTGALAAAVVFMVTGFFTTPGHQAIVLTASWLPWAFYAIRRGSPVVVAIVLALLVLAGHPQVAYYCFLLCFAWALVCHGWKRALIRFLPALVLALGIASVQLFPTYRLAAESSRAELGYDYSTSFGFAPYFLSAIVAPRGQVRLPDQDGAAPLHLYAGIGSLLLAFIGLTLSRKRERLFFFAAALAALLLSFGRESPLYDLLYAGLPGFRSFRVPYRLLGVWAFGVAVLSGLGLETMASPSRRLRLTLRRIAQGAFVLFVALALWAADVHLRLLPRPGALGPEDVERIVGSAYWAVLLAALNFLLLLLVLWRPKQTWALPAFVALLALDLGAFVKDRGQHPYRTLVRADERAIQGVLRAQREKSRYVTDSNLESYDMIFGTEFAGGHAALVDRGYQALLDQSMTSANALSILNVKFVVRSTPRSEYPWCGPRYASPLPLLDVPPEIAPASLALTPPIEAQRLVFFWSPLGPGGTATFDVLGRSHPLVTGEPLAIDLEAPTSVGAFRVRVARGNPGVRIEDVEADLNPIGLKADFLGLDGIQVNLHALPRAYFVVPSPVPAERQTLETLRCWTVHRGIQVVDPETGEGASGFFRKDAVEIESYSSELVELRTSSPREGFLVLSDTFHAGWTAEVDGKPARIRRAQEVMRAVFVPAGRHRVRFHYRPRSLRVGGAVSAASLFLLATWVGIGIFRRRRGERPDGAS